ncbi:hypothetical protein AB0H71_02510 [Nocardia sp. NPDC050697]|uniref:hypothetical protein n=1 Tax=Nocardia sp. NPDC050697 TaxID=3155158 RepID=UPI0033C50F79
MRRRTVRMGSTTAVAAAAVAVLTVAAAPASAEPAPAAPARFSAVLHDRTLVTTLTGGQFTVVPDRDVVQVSDSVGVPIATLPLTFAVNDRIFPIAHAFSADGRELALTPDLDAVRSAALQPVASPVEEQLALNYLAGELGKNLGIGGFAGSVLGALVGLAVGLGSCLLVGPGCLATLPLALGAFAGAGGVVGTLVGGGAALADGLWKYVLTLQAAPGQSPYANQGGLLDPNGTGVPDSPLRLPSGSADGLEAGSSSGSGG